MYEYAFCKYDIIISTYKNIFEMITQGVIVDEASVPSVKIRLATGADLAKHMAYEEHRIAV